MAWFDSHLLTALVFFPIAASLPIVFLPSNAAKNWALLISLLTFALSLVIYGRFDGSTAEFQFGELTGWIPGLGVSYRLGMDGISLWLALLTTFLQPLVVLG